jgi:hypothetical protein
MRSRPERKLPIAMKNARCLSSRPGLLSNKFVIKNATRTLADMKSFRYCSQTNNAMSVISPPTKSMPFLMFPALTMSPNQGNTRPLHARAQRREEAGCVMEHNT